MFVAGRKVGVGVIRGARDRLEMGGKVITGKDTALRGIEEESMGM